MEKMVSKIANATPESALDTIGRPREQKNEKLKSKTKHINQSINQSNKQRNQLL